MAQFTAEERNALYALFDIDEHEVREGATNKTSGKITWFTYVRREAIQRRLDDLFFGEWELYFLNSANPYTYHKEHVDCAMGLSIRGIRREYNGSQDGGGLNGAKGAATDAFKRVVSMWGIGLYLQSSPVIRTDGYKDSEGKVDWKKKDAMEESAMLQVEKWLRVIGASGTAISPVIEEIKPNPLDLGTHLGSGKTTPTKEEEIRANWEYAINTLIRPFYDNENHWGNALNSAIRNEIVLENMPVNHAVAAIVYHRAKKEFGFDKETVVKVLKKHPEEVLQNVDAFYKVWQLLVKHNKENPL